ncbi:uncharacterized protein LOC135166809 isoform X4 [Diachasmimorpha longicaudata]|uniref:uncharacterized protein LOC135166809 isoform X4 n=1 Tax=Diachasmimorpha longicaudata TaxID=58733 RepID=UPI0030B89AD4
MRSTGERKLVRTRPIVNRKLFWEMPQSFYARLLHRTYHPFDPSLYSVFHRERRNICPNYPRVLWSFYEAHGNPQDYDERRSIGGENKCEEEYYWDTAHAFSPLGCRNC